MSIRRLACILSSVVVFGLPAAGCTASMSPSASDLPAAVQPPCDGAVLHDRNPYTACDSGGYVAQMEDDSWCCPDGSTPTTHTVVAVTDTACGGSTETAPACGQPGSGCDSSVCKGTAYCTKKYGDCMCVTTKQQNCTIKGSACVDSGCSSTTGAACSFYDNGTDSGCVCAIQ